MADRKQGAGLSSGSSAAVHKANCDFFSGNSGFISQNLDIKSELRVKFTIPFKFHIKSISKEKLRFISQF